MQKPQFKNYGLTPYEFERFQKLRNRYENLREVHRRVWRKLLFPIAMLLAWHYGIWHRVIDSSPQWMAVAKGLGLAVSGLLAGEILKHPLALLSHETQLLLSFQSYNFYLHKSHAVIRFEQDVAAYKRSTVQRRTAGSDARSNRGRSFWRALNGFKLQKELANLFRQMGYEVTVIPSSDNDRAELCLQKGDKKAVLLSQAYGQSAHAQSAIELIDAKQRFKADQAILVSFGGFDNDAKDLAHQHSIKLMSDNDIVRIQTELANRH